MEIRKTSDDIVLDTRTPPKIRAQTKKKEKDDHMEYSHAGVAIPVDEDSIKLEETTKKLNFYKVQRPTTNSGLSTWILLSGDSSSTTPQAVNVKDTEDMKVIEVSGAKIVKPVFKKRTTTRRTTTQPTTHKNKIGSETTTKKSKPSNLVKIKASTLNDAKKKNDTKTIGTSIKEVTEHPIEKTKMPLFNRLSNIKTTTEKLHVETTTLNNGDKTTTIISSTINPKNNTIDSQNLELEAKEGDTNITESTTNNKKKKNKTKKNKNKNRRKKPQEKTSNSTTTKLAKTKNQIKEKPIGTQIYNYLSREMMPTLGVGLVGLMVTAGLASYFLYPFAAARRIYEVDRKDKEGAYYYNDVYSGGIAEEEAFGKVIAGMPLEKLQSSMYSSAQTTRRPVHQQKNYYPTQKNFANHQTHHQKHNVPQNTKNYHSKQVFNNVKHNNNQNVMVQGTVESVPLGPTKDSYLVNTYNKDSYQLVNYKNNEVDANKDSEQKFVVGNAPKGSIEEITPIAVPEHGPRMLKLRRKRREVDDMENDIFSDKEMSEMSTIGNGISEKLTTIEVKPDYSTNAPTSTTNSPTDPLENKVHSVVELIKDIFHLKINLGLELVKNATRSISNYIERVQSKIDSHYRTSQKFFIR